MKKRADKLSEIVRAFNLEVIYAFGSHAEDALKWLKDEQSSLLILSPSDLDIGIKPAVKKVISKRKSPPDNGQGLDPSSPGNNGWKALSENPYAPSSPGRWTESASLKPEGTQPPF